MTPKRTLLCAAALLLTSSTAALGQHDPVNVTFEGGHARAYVEALLKASEGINILCGEDVDAIAMQPVTLRKADFDSAIYLLEDLEGERGGRRLRLSVDSMPQSNPTASPVYRVTAITLAQQGRVGRSTPPPKLLSHAWSLRSIVDGGVAHTDVLSAINAALDLYDDDAPPARMVYHEGTRLLLARAMPEQIQVVEGVIDAIEGDMPRQPTAALEQTNEPSALLDERRADGATAPQRVALKREDADRLRMTAMGHATDPSGG